MKIFSFYKKFINIWFLLLCTLFVTSCGLQGVTSVEDGYYTADISMEGGTGKATIDSPTTVYVEDGNFYATLVWSSQNYDYMIMDGQKYLNENEGGNSTFTIPVADISQPLSVIADTVAMSRPHEIEYTLTLSNLQKSEELEKENTPDFSKMEVTGQVQMQYATQLKVQEYGAYYVVQIADKDSYLVVPPGKRVLANLPKDMVVLKQPLDHTYLVSTAVMDLVRECGSLNQILFSGTKEEDWSISQAREAMSSGAICYAGKYSMPDYELLLSKGCDLAIENTMIYHNPEVKEKLEELGIPVLVEYSSYEEHPLGRLEWIKLYGILYGKQEVADAYFDQQLSMIEPVLNGQQSNKTVAFFYVTTNGSVNVRKPNDYISKMIEMAGGRYVLKDEKVEEENALSTMNMQMEAFYQAAKDADVLIYNSTIMGELESLEDLLRMDNVFADFKAVKNGNVYCTSKDFFQETTQIAEFMKELQGVLAQENAEYTYLKKVE